MIVVEIPYPDFWFIAKNCKTTIEKAPMETSATTEKKENTWKYKKFLDIFSLETKTRYVQVIHFSTRSENLSFCIDRSWMITIESETGTSVKSNIASKLNNESLGARNVCKKINKGHRNQHMRFPFLPEHLSCIMF